MEQFNNFPRIALAHDSFTQLGGAERVIEALHELYPKAPVFTLVFGRKLKSKYKDWDIRTSWLQVFYNWIPKLQYLLPFIPLAVSSLDFSQYDIVLSSSSGFVKNIKVPKSCVHLNYCHTPARFLWGDENYLRDEVPAILRPLVKIVLNRMRRWDYKGAQRVNFFIANSKEVQQRIKKYYNRDSIIIYPFVDTSFWKPVQYSPPFEGGEPSRSEGEVVGVPIDVSPTTPSPLSGDAPPRAGGEAPRKSNYFLLAGRLQAHKNNELVIKIFNELGLPLHVAGTGRQENYLKSMAKSNITFLGRVSDEDLRAQYSGALGLIYPQLEDFGLMPLEVACCGTATLAYGKGGVLETVVPGVTGELFGTDDVARPFMGWSENMAADKSARYKYQIKQLILSWNPQKYKFDDLRAQAEKFSKEKFKQAVLKFLETNNFHGRESH